MPVLRQSLQFLVRVFSFFSYFCVIHTSVLSRWSLKLNAITFRYINAGLNLIFMYLCFKGVMKLDDLKHVFKSSSIGPVDTRGYIVNLLNKFEVALTWDSRTLLIPSLLPSEESMRAAHTQLVRVKVLLSTSYCLL